MRISFLCLLWQTGQNYKNVTFFLLIASMYYSGQILRLWQKVNIREFIGKQITPEPCGCFFYYPDLFSCSRKCWVLQEKNKQPRSVRIKRLYLVIISHTHIYALHTIYIHIHCPGILLQYRSCYQMFKTLTVSFARPLLRDTYLYIHYYPTHECSGWVRAYFT